VPQTDSEDAPTTFGPPRTAAAPWAPPRAPEAVPDPGAEPQSRGPFRPAPTLPPPPSTRSASLLPEAPAGLPELAAGATIIPPDDFDADWMPEGDADETMLLVRPDLKKRDY
jgi:hypothetical protein